MRPARTAPIVALAFLVTAFAPATLLPAAEAQGFDNRWVEFRPAPNPGDFDAVSSGGTQAELASGDFDGDGWIDLVAARKEPYTTLGKRPNLLFMNELGVLRDLTAQFAAGSDVSGDQGFLTPTNDRDIAVFDFDLDGDLDLVTAVTVSDFDPKHIGHPRFYLNLGLASGAWGGFRFEAGRTPQLFQAMSGVPLTPRFAAVATGDVTGDGHADAYFVDHDASGAGGAGQPLGQDANDRLLVNDGTGYFSDESAARMTPLMLRSAYGFECKIADVNGDGLNDVIKGTALNVPQYVAALYNDPAVPGTFKMSDAIYQLGPYGMDVADLNGDGRLDLIVSDNQDDRYLLNSGTDAFGRATWSDPRRYTFLKGGDDGFASDALAVDLDGDGYPDALHCDVSDDIPLGAFDTRYLHIYHNVIASGSGMNFVEERAEPDESWRGVFGMQRGDLVATYDVAVFDLDRDGDNEMLLSRIEGGTIWINQTNPEVCQSDLGFGGPGSAVLEVCGQPLINGLPARAALSGAAPGAAGFLAIGQQFDPTPMFGGTAVPLPISMLIPLTTDPGGIWSLDYTVATSVPTTLFLQAAVLDATVSGGVAFSNAVRAELN